MSYRESDIETPRPFGGHATPCDRLPPASSFMLWRSCMHPPKHQHPTCFLQHAFTCFNIYKNSKVMVRLTRGCTPDVLRASGWAVGQECQGGVIGYVTGDWQGKVRPRQCGGPRNWRAKTWAGIVCKIHKKKIKVVCKGTEERHLRWSGWQEIVLKN